MVQECVRLKIQNLNLFYALFLVRDFYMRFFYYVNKFCEKIYRNLILSFLWKLERVFYLEELWRVVLYFLNLHNFFYSIIIFITKVICILYLFSLIYILFFSSYFDNVDMIEKEVFRPFQTLSERIFWTNAMFVWLCFF